MPDSNTELLLEGKKPALKRKPVACAEGWEKREMGGRSVFVCAPPPPKAVGGGCKAVETPPPHIQTRRGNGKSLQCVNPCRGGGMGHGFANGRTASRRRATSPGCAVRAALHSCLRSPPSAPWEGPGSRSVPPSHQSQAPPRTTLGTAGGREAKQKARNLPLHQ